MANYKIVSHGGSGLPLNVYGSGTITSRRNVCIWTDTGSTDQQWAIASLVSNQQVKSLNNLNYMLNANTLDGMAHEVSCNGRKVSLTRLEFDLLLMLASHEGQIFSKEELFRAVWGQNCDDTLKVVANTVSNLRKKLAGCGSFIRTTHGGYAFVSQKENDPA